MNRPDARSRRSGPRRNEDREADPVRLAVVGLLLRVERKHASIDGPLRLAAESFGERDRRFLWNLTQETIRWQARLDAVVAPLLHRPILRLEPVVRILLRIMACQVCLFESVPDHAAVSETVRLARKVATPGAAKLINAIGRRLVGDGKARWDILGARSRIEDWPVVHSHPAWLIKRWIERWGEEQALRILQWDNQHPPIWLRARPGGPIPAGEVGWVPETYRMPEGYRPGSDPSFQAGSWTVQDPSETLIGTLPPDRSPVAIVDLCAAPGTKTTQLALRYPTSQILAMDRSRIRVSRLRETLSRMRTEAWIVAGDAIDPPIRNESCDGILVDAPCSALGVLRRRVDARWNVTPRGITRRAATQREILSGAVALLRKGGWILYSVCSVEPEETEDVRRWFMQRFPDFKSIDFPFELPAEVRVDRGVLRILPGQLECDGVYACLLERSR